MRGVIAISLILLASPAQAGEASFDCSRAATPVEKEICKDENAGLGLRDRVMAALHTAVKEQGGQSEILSRQKAWLRQRDACGPKPACLARRYDQRIAELAAAAGDDRRVTGTYGYSLSRDTDFGTAFVARMADGTLTGAISTVSGPTFHSCELEFDGAGPQAASWVWTDTEESYGGGFCTVTLAPGRDRLTISSENCSNYCGARGWFDETYTRTK